jgi:predicted AlkP superfamily pyrophosphatase or phosphodiesterase
VLTQAELETFATRNIVWRDRIWTDAAIHILETHRPNLMLFHLLSLDSMQHRYGPRTLATTATMALLDTQVAQIVAAVERAGLTPRTTFFVVSDHGFKLVKRQIRLNVALAQAGLITVQGGKITASQAYAVPEGGSAIVFVVAPDPTGDILGRASSARTGIRRRIPTSARSSSHPAPAFGPASGSTSSTTSTSRRRWPRFWA